MNRFKTISKRFFPPKIKAQLLERDNIDTTIGKLRVLLLLVKSELLQFTISTMLAHVTDRNKETKCSGKAIKMKPNTFHEAFCKRGIDQGGLTRLTQANNSKHDSS